MNLNKRIKNLSKKLKTIEESDGFICDEDGRAIINVGAENYDDIFSPYCFKGGDTLSLELDDYLCYQEAVVPLDYDLTLRFYVKNANESKRKEIQNAVKQNYESDIHTLENKTKRLNVIATWFLILGTIFTVVYFAVLSYLPKAITTTYIIDILAWIFIWEGASALIIDKRGLVRDRVRMLRLASAKVEVKEFEPY